MRRDFVIIILLLLSFSMSHATDDGVTDDFPTYALVTETDLPPLDRVEIAERLLGVSLDENRVLPVITRQIGDTQTFFIGATASGGMATISAELQAIGESVYVWIEVDSGFSGDLSMTIAQRFDRDVYAFVGDLWNSEPSLGIDGESRIHLVITSQLRSGLGGYFSASNAFPAEIALFSNEKDMLVLSSSIIDNDLDTAMSSAAHELVHLLHFSKDVNEENWLNEGFATLTEYLLGIERQTSLIDALATAPQTSLTHWGTGNNRRAEYGAPMLFMLYLYDHFGEDALREIMLNEANSLQSIDTVLQGYGVSDVETIFADWVVANLMRRDGSIYGYQSLTHPTPMLMRSMIPETGATFSSELQAYSTHYYRYFAVPDQATISIDMNDSVPLIPTTATSGGMFWYSQTGDGSNPRLTRSFDLREVTSANLTYNIWYDLETEWDYGYISVSVDSGQTWALQAASSTTTANANGRAYGLGYTGRTREWQTETLSLDDYVGQEILVRFEMVTDDAIHFGGIALDDVRLEVIGYQSDFEADDGGWQSEGWIRTDNRLPPRMWVQVIEELPNDVRVHRFLVADDDSWTLNFDADAVRVYLALSPLIPITLEPLGYTLQVE